ncbi:hypothetical protein PVL29_008014 [Vitis rotundifolia]|uniref:Uncharacterized protein n=1 Tax=Vitis rotundifolia TaxID=103349 RepID=A0AA39DZ49_VITRO|nr:hypothetical protein PVL29_008014 [Vitis rotundifolia]
MEFVGRPVKKEFHGFGIFSGLVKSYDPESGFFEVLYEDGDSEELEWSELALLLEGEVADPGLVELTQKPRVGRKPKKRRRVEIKPEIPENSGNSSGHLDNLNGGFSETLGNSGEGVGKFGVNGGFDLNDGFNLNNGCSLSVDCEENVTRSNYIDLNLNVNGDFDESSKAGELGCAVVETRKKGCSFDLNLGLDDEMKDADVECGGQLKEIHLVGGGGGANGTLEGGVSTKGVNDSREFVLGDSGLWQVGVPREDGISMALWMENASNCVNHSAFSEVQLEGLSGGSIAVISGCQGNSVSPYNEGKRGRKRRKLLNNLTSGTETVLRRSTRRGSAQKGNVSSTMVPFAVSDGSPSAAVSLVSEGKPIISGHAGIEDCIGLPPKLQLPPSSQNLNLEGIPIFDFFSVYAFLRSFSTLLYLSPFELEDFVEASRCNFSNPLFDSVHVSLLQTLRKHLEFLSDEGSQSASSCLRCLNWGLLDSVTWPVFMAEYLLIHGSGLKPGFDFSCLKLFDNDYCKQPVAVKVEILRCLCDDVIEVEALRSELSRRSLAAEPDMEFNRNVNIEICKKRRAMMDVSGGSCLAEEVVDEINDWNSDECCLCKMDGNLICCDGCPAAYHSRCVGVASDLLPEGDWYCPECMIDKDKPWMKQRKSLRGAELLGVDPHGRLYFSSYGYLLVSDSCDTESSFNHYSRNELNVVIEVLKSSEIHYGEIITAICKHWGSSINLNGETSSLDSENRAIFSDMVRKAQTTAICMTPLPLTPETCAVKEESTDERKSGEKSVAEVSLSCGVSKSITLLNSTIVNSSMEIENPIASSEQSAEIIQSSTGIQTFQNHGSDCLNMSARISNQAESPEKTPPVGNCSISTSIDVEPEKKIESAVDGHTSSPIHTRKEDVSQVQCGIDYTNYYSFAQTASSVAEELMHKSSDKSKEHSTTSAEEIISAQIKAISKNFTKFCWPNAQNLNTDAEKENCGWCFSCKDSTGDRNCLFKTNFMVPVQEGSKSEVVGLQSKKNRKGHLVEVINYILSIEVRLRGLLLGPWMNPHHAKLWCKNALKASDVASVKHLLLTVLPRSLASKAARQAGCTKILGILYPESSEFAKRNKYVVWRSAVETSTSVEQLALLVRELDLNIRWDDIENTHPLFKLDKEARKSIRPFRKVIIRRKCIEGTVSKYLLDFGKRKIIPDVVVKHGSILEESSSERKKYWLDESHVPLHLLKAFEEKRIARKSGNINSGKLHEGGREMKRPSKDKGFSYLFLKAERSENYQCGHCKKGVLTREAVSCQYCKGYFHKRHVRKSAGSISAECMYTCHKCQDGKPMKINTKIGMSSLKRVKKAPQICIRKKEKPTKIAGYWDQKVVKKFSQRNSLCVRVRVENPPQANGLYDHLSREKFPQLFLFGVQQGKLNLCLCKIKILKDRTKANREKVNRKKIGFMEMLLDLMWKLLVMLSILGAMNAVRGHPLHAHICKGMSRDETQLDEVKSDVGIDCLVPPSEAYVRQKSQSDEDSPGLFVVDESIHKEEQVDAVPGSNQGPILKPKLEGENGHLLAFEMQKTDATESSDDKDFDAGVPMKTEENLTLEENTIELGKENVTVEPPSCEADVDMTDTEIASSRHEEETNGLLKSIILDEAVGDSLFQAKLLSCKADVDVTDTEMGSSRHEEATNGLLKTSVILKEPVDGTLVDSSKLHQTILASGELLDMGEKKCLD